MDCHDNCISVGEPVKKDNILHEIEANLNRTKKLQRVFIFQITEYIPPKKRSHWFKVRSKLWVRLKARHIFLLPKLLEGEFLIF